MMTSDSSSEIYQLRQEVLELRRELAQAKEDNIFLRQIIAKALSG